MNETFLVVTSADIAELLDAWRWLVPDTMSIHSVTALGDAFLRNGDDSIHWLDVGRGRLIQVADSSAAFERVLAVSSVAEEWLMPALLTELRRLHPPLQRGQCYGFVLPPCVGGSYEPSNFEPTALALHFGIVGQLHEQSRVHPDGTPIRGFFTSEPGTA